MVCQIYEFSKSICAFEVAKFISLIVSIIHSIEELLVCSYRSIDIISLVFESYDDVVDVFSRSVSCNGSILVEDAIDFFRQACLHLVIAYSFNASDEVVGNGCCIFTNVAKAMDAEVIELEPTVTTCAIARVAESCCDVAIGAKTEGQCTIIYVCAYFDRLELSVCLRLNKVSIVEDFATILCLENLSVVFSFGSEESRIHVTENTLCGTT